MDIERIIVSFLKSADAKRNLLSLLEYEIRPELIKGLRVDSLLRGVADYVGGKMGGVDDELIKQDVVDMLIDERKKIMDELTSKIRVNLTDDFYMLMKESYKAVDPRESFPVEYKDQIGAISEKVTKITYKFLNDALMLRAKRWVNEHSDEPFYEGPGGKVIKEPETRALHEDVLEKLDELRREGELGGAIGAFLEGKGSKRKEYEAILEGHVLGCPLSDINKPWDPKKKPDLKTLEELGKELGIHLDTVAEREKEMLESFKKFLTGYEPEKVENKGVKGPGGIPKYTEILKNEKESKDFRDFYKIGKGTRRPVSEKTERIIEMLAEGKDVGEISEKLGIIRQVVTNTKTRYFDSEYERWYMKRHSSLREAILRLAKLIGAVYPPLPKSVPKGPEKPSGEPKTVRIKAPGKKGPGPAEKGPAEESEKGPIGFNWVVDLFDSPRTAPFTIHIDFHSDYDNVAVVSGKVDPSVDDAHFRYENYVIGGIRKNSPIVVEKYGYEVSYLYTCPLNNDGTFKGSGESDLKVTKGGSAVDSGDLQGRLDAVIDGVKKEGMIPGKGYTSYFHNSSESEHVKDRQEMPSSAFITRYRGLPGFIDPETHRKLKEYEEWEKKRQEHRLGPGEYAVSKEIKDILNRLKKELSVERGKGEIRQNKDLIKQTEQEIAKWEKVIEEHKQVAEKELEEAEERLNARTVVSRMLKSLKESMGKLQERLGVIREQLKDKDRDKGKDDEKTIEIKKYEDMIKEKNADIGKLEGMIEHRDYDLGAIKEMKKRILPEKFAAAPLPGPQSGAVKGLYEVFSDYNMDKPNPVLWFDKRDFIRAAKTLRSLMDMDFKKSVNKFRGKSRQERIDEQKAMMEKDLAVAKKGFEELVADLRKRRDMFKSRDPEGYRDYFSRRDPGWVDNESERGQAEREAQQALRGEWHVEEMPKAQPSTHMIEKNKFEFLEDFLTQIQSGIHELAVRFKGASLEPNKERAVAEVATVARERTRLNSEIDKAKNELEKLRKQKIEDEFGELYRRKNELVDKLRQFEKEESISEEALKKIKPIQEEIDKIRTVLPSKPDLDSGEIKDAVDSLYRSIGDLSNEDFRLKGREADLEMIPAAVAAAGLRGTLKYFRDMYSKLHSFLWFREKPEVLKSAEEEEAPAEEKKGPEYYGNLREEIIDGAMTISGIRPLRSEDSYKKIVSQFNIVSKKLGEFLGEYLLSRAPKKAPRKQEAPAMLSYMKLGECLKLSYEKVSAETREEKIEKFVIPESIRHDAEEMIKKMEHSDRAEFRKVAPKARAEFRGIVDGLVKAFHEGLPIDRVREVAKEKKISENEARLLLKKHEDAMMRSAVRAFNDKWLDAMDIGRVPREKKEREYSEIENIVEEMVPGLFELWPGEKEPEEPAMAIPTPAEMMDRIMEQIKVSAPDEAIEVYEEEYFKDWSGIERGGGAKRKVRPKVIKAPPPEGTWQELKEQVADLVKNREPDEAVNRVLAMYLMRVKGAVGKASEEDGYIPVREVIEGVVKLLKNFYFSITNLDAAPSQKVQKMIGRPGESAGGVQYMTGTPDLVIDTSKEAEAVFDKIVGIIDQINFYIAPDSIGKPPLKYIPPGGPSTLSLKETQKYLPRGLVDWYQQLKKWEERKKASILSSQITDLSMRVASSFIGQDLSLIDSEDPVRALF